MDILNLPLSYLSKLTLWIEDEPYITYATPKIQLRVPVDWSETKQYRVRVSGFAENRTQEIISNEVFIDFNSNRQTITNEAVYIIGFVTMSVISLTTCVCCARFLWRRYRAKMKSNNNSNRFRQFQADIQLDTID